MKIQIQRRKDGKLVLEYPQLTFYGEIKQKYIILNNLKQIYKFIETLKAKPHPDNFNQYTKENYNQFINNQLTKKLCKKTKI